ncbi:MAG: thioredoxin family protein [Sphingobacteriales bacterium JAD_PAG50586_3]|nr:MAG: thioredoxin family protein [Sphingobacteriales bacterium JAD_PAG50586_3]
MSVNATTNFKSYIDKSVDFGAYTAAFETVVEQNTNLPEAEQIPYFQYYPLNLQRSHRVYKQYKLTDELLAAIEALANPIHWLVITEHWCGDSAQSLPVIARIAEASAGKIKLHIVYRDENTELIDQFLTNGGRSIPVLLQLNNDYELLTKWGPRPVAAQELLYKLKEDNVAHDDYITIIHKWYADDKAASISKELVELIKAVK